MIVGVAAFSAHYKLFKLSLSTSNMDKQRRKDALGIGMTGIGSGKILEFDLKIAANTAKVVNSLISEKLELMKLLELLVLNLQEQLL
jgi:hypothetical protein